MKTNKDWHGKKSVIASLLLGLGFILFIQIILAIINFQVAGHQFSASSVEQLQQQFKYRTQLQIIIGWIGQLVSVASFIVAGMIGTWKIKKSEWLYGGLVGVVWQALILVLSLVVLMLYAYYPTQTKEISRVLSGIPRIFLYISIPLTTFGGLMVHLMHQKQKQ